MDRLMDSWPWWGWPPVWTALTIAVAYAIGYVIRAVVAAQLAKIAARTLPNWDDIVIDELKRRIPFWSGLVGGGFAAGRGPLPPAAALLITRILAALGVASVTRALAAMAT